MSFAVEGVSPAGRQLTTRGGDARRVLAAVRLHQTVLPALLVLVAMALVAIFADLFSPADPRAGSLEARLVPPFARGGHLLGTDAIGRDVLARLIYGARISLSVGVVSVLIAVAFGGALGLLAGYRGRWVDALVMRLADVQLSFPSFLLAISLMAVLGAGVANVILALSIGGWVRYARVMRSSVLPLREVEYVQAARAVGCGPARVMLRHVLPNAAIPVMVLATLSLGANIITESSLSFLGLGVDPQTPSWGSMLSEGRSYLASAWWVAALPGLAISATVLAVNIVGDWLRDELDPRMKRR
ncbi:MAG TPA: ABC transporter permease [Chloroflexota bacterium]|nr:ABC transporter permease [Chloroflexota bacterium]